MAAAGNTAALSGSLTFPNWCKRLSELPEVSAETLLRASPGGAANATGSGGSLSRLPAVNVCRRGGMPAAGAALGDRTLGVRERAGRYQTRPTLCAANWFFRGEIDERIEMVLT